MTIKDIYNTVARYDITDDVQEIPLKFNYDRLLKEILDFIERNKYGFFVTSLKLDHETTDLSEYNQFSEVLQYNAKGVASWYHANSEIVDNRNNSNYTFWHPDLSSSYVREISEQLESLTGFKIGQVRLAWLLPDRGYSMHADTEALRFHIPLLTNDYAYFLINDQIHHMDIGKLYHLQTTEYHSAFNLGPVPRLHIVFSTCTWPELDQAVNELVSSKNISQEIITKLKEQNYSADTIQQLAKIFGDSNTETGAIYNQLFSHMSQMLK